MEALRRPEFVEELHEAVVDHESYSHVEANTTEARNRSFVETETD